MKRFTTTGTCNPDRHYMVDISDRLEHLKQMVDDGEYMMLHRGRQYGKTTTLFLLKRYLQPDYTVLWLDLETISTESLQDSAKFIASVSYAILRSKKTAQIPATIVDKLTEFTKPDNSHLRHLFHVFDEWISISEKPIVLLIDEVDYPSNFPIFYNFLAQLRARRNLREDAPHFQSVILCGLTDVTYSKKFTRPDGTEYETIPFTLAVDFDDDMSLSTDGIANMLRDYANEHQIDFDIDAVAQEIRDYTSGYPVLVSRICQIIDENLHNITDNVPEDRLWTVDGVREAVRLLLDEDNPLFNELIGIVLDSEPLRNELREHLLDGQPLLYDVYQDEGFRAAEDHYLTKHTGFIEATVTNRIFEMLFRNAFQAEAHNNAILHSRAQKSREK